MFYHIEGKLAELEPGLAVIDCSGVGYALGITAFTASRLHLGEKTKLYVAESIGENNFDLYGFSGKNEKHCFDMLISVSGIGPKAAMAILSSISPEGLALAVMNGDEKSLTAAPGIGKKTAQRIILELKDKVSKDPGLKDMDIRPVQSAAAGDTVLSDVMAALTVLGYSSAEVGPVLRKIDTSSMAAEDIIKVVLRQMVK